MLLGFENNTYEILSYVDGDTLDYPLSVDVKSKEALISSAKILRKYHDVSEPYIAEVKPSVNGWMFPAKKPIEVICHNDFAPYNICFKNKQAIGIIDFEVAIPGPRIWDIAYALYRFAPFTSPNNSDGFGTLPEQIERAALFCDTYELPHTERLNLADTIIARLEDLISFLQSAAEDGDKKYQCNIKDGHLQLYSQDLQYIRKNKGIIDAGLTKEAAMTIRLLEKTDIAVIVDGFKESGWQIKPASVFEQYLDEQEQYKRICLVAFVGEKFAGYVTLKWQSDYKNFATDNIPEISDLNVLPLIMAVNLLNLVYLDYKEYILISAIQELLIKRDR